MISVTKRFEFCYGHYLPCYLGKCARQHGHNATLEVEVGMEDTVFMNELGIDGDAGKGPKDYVPEYIPRPNGKSCYKGMVMDFGDLKDVVLPILEQFDHQNINDIAPGPVTAEYMTMALAAAIEYLLGPPLHLLRVRLYETPSSWAEWRV